ncbi:MAG: UDP-N-acetylmuramoyl-L-alanine--D-glutamate ligase, partial [Betaproteobacteria bacterium]|nr:UDP-N-acetylmuramoyl-L-alanine--D-glutamate ligase [Betaproteobacteria bacterium]
ISRHSGLEAAVQAASQRARTGEAVLLSPACASFDMFRDYKHRAARFASAIDELAGVMA